MSTQRFMARICKSPGRFTFALLLGALLALPYLWPAAAFARVGGQKMEVHSLSPSPTVPASVLNKVGVSMVRLVATYGTTPSHVTCTSLGVLVASQAPSASSKNYVNWILTDGNLVNTTMTECGKPGNTLVLNDIQIWASSEYTGGNPTLLGHLMCSAPGGFASCNDASLPSSIPDPIIFPPTATSTSYALLSFQSAAGEPYVGLSSSTNAPGATNTTWNVGLTQSAGSVYPYKNTDGKSGPVANFKEYLTPNAVVDPPAIPTNIPPSQSSLLASTNAIEGGTPEIDAQGQIVGLWVNNSTGGYMALSMEILRGIWTTNGLPLALLLTPATQACTVASCWNTGIDAFYHSPASPTTYTQAHENLSKVSALNPQFIAAHDFDALALQHLPGVQKKIGTASGTPATSPAQITLTQPQLLAIVVLLVVVVIAVVVLAVRAQKRRRELAKFDAEFAEGRRIAAEQAAQNQRAQSPQPVPSASCPNCHNPVHLTDTICPYCRFPLSPTASGMGVRLMGTAPIVSSPLSPPPVSVISEQPTVLFPPGPPPPPPADLSQMTMQRQQVQAHEEATQEIHQLYGRNLSLAVGTRSDPGIKRKHKPNEDSLFAMQGARTHNSQPQQFGLFVVADGMGGHANGQDASRLAIQTIIDFMLPRVSNGEPMDDEAFLQLMGDGVQQANQAVHDSNMESHADMGTTMTAALVVAATAYVANVGDSRTYLYREGQGLSKVTHDHSVVASLVEAGIIQPDDVYTHPKRNQIYRSLGEKPVVEVDTFKIDLLPGDKLLLCSDGLWDMVRDPLIQDVLGKTTRDPNRTGQDLIKAALDGGGEDNVSVIVVQFAETNERTGMTGVQLLAKPESVTVPNLPPL